MKRILVREVTSGYIVQELKNDWEVPNEYAAESVDTVLSIIQDLLTKKEELLTEDTLEILRRIEDE